MGAANVLQQVPNVNICRELGDSHRMVLDQSSQCRCHAIRPGTVIPPMSQSQRQESLENDAGKILPVSAAPGLRERAFVEFFP